MKIIADAHIPFVQEYFGSCGKLILKPGRAIRAADVRDADILLVRSVTHVDEQLLANSKVKFVGSVTAGADHLDTRWLEKAGIDWSAAAGFNAPPVADYVISVIAALQKKGMLTQKKLKAAIIGAGNAGRLAAERLEHLKMEVNLCDPLRAQHEEDFNSIPLEEISDVDLISLHVPLTQSGEHATYHFIDKHFLQKQKAGCVLLNASRGAVIHSQDLLDYGAHLYWCFDVWEHEPDIDKTILKKALIATPHIAGYSVQSKIRGIDMIYRVMCDKKLIEPNLKPPLGMPVQQLEFSGENLSWQDIVLGVFNPDVITAMLNTILLSATDHGRFFDEMRHQFNYRYEFDYTKINHASLSSQDKILLQKFGMKL